MEFTSVKGNFKGTYGIFRMMPADGGKKTLMFGVASINAENDDSFLTKVAKSGAFPMNVVLNVLTSQFSLASIKAEAERREKEDPSKWSFLRSGAFEFRLSFLQGCLDSFHEVRGRLGKHDLVRVHMHEGAVLGRGYGVYTALYHLGRYGRLGRVFGGHFHGAFHELIPGSDFVYESPVSQRRGFFLSSQHDHALGPGRPDQVDA